MEEIRRCLDELVEAVKICPELARYREARARLAEYPDKEKRIQEFRAKTYELQNQGDTVDMFAEMDRLADTYHDVYHDDVMKEFVNAEIALCKIVQTIEKEVIGCLDFERI